MLELIEDGSCSNTGILGPASTRGYNLPSRSSPNLGFRITLYLNN